MAEIDATAPHAVPQLAIFTDFDGTLVEIAETPDAIEVPDTLASQLQRASEELDSAFAVLTGREIADIDRYLAPLHLPVAGARAFARSGSVDWLDPMIGARLRYAVAPGHELVLRGDIGGFGLGSDFSWQAIGAYGFDLGTYQGITFSGVIGYRALYVDYAQGEGRRRYEFDMLQHGPVLGLSARF